jgi:hypothetical protein
MTMDQVNRQVAPAVRRGNGLPEPGGYVYRGTGQDVMPWAVTDDQSSRYETGGNRRRPERRAGCCPGCGYSMRGINHRTLCA